MIKYLGPRKFYCAVITALVGPFSFCLRGISLSLLGKAKAGEVSSTCTEGLFMCIWSYLKYVAGLEQDWQCVCYRETVPTVSRASSKQEQEMDQDLTWRGATGSASKTIQARSSESWKTCMNVSKERERLTGTGEVLKNPYCLIHKWVFILPLEASRLDFPLRFLWM